MRQEGEELDDFLRSTYTHWDFSVWARATHRTPLTWGARGGILKNQSTGSEEWRGDVEGVWEPDVTHPLGDLLVRAELQ